MYQDNLHLATLKLHQCMFLMGIVSVRYKNAQYISYISGNVQTIKKCNVGLFLCFFVLPFIFSVKKND